MKPFKKYKISLFISQNYISVAILDSHSLNYICTNIKYVIMCYPQRSFHQQINKFPTRVSQKTQPLHNTYTVHNYVLFTNYLVFWGHPIYYLSTRAKMNNLTNVVNKLFSSTMVSSCSNNIVTTIVLCQHRTTIDRTILINIVNSTSVVEPW